MPESPYDRAVKRLARLWNDIDSDTYGVVLTVMIHVLGCEGTALASDVMAQRRRNEDEASQCRY